MDSVYIIMINQLRLLCMNRSCCVMASSEDVCSLSCFIIIHVRLLVFSMIDMMHRIGRRELKSFEEDENFRDSAGLKRHEQREI